jgi:alkanesulfonate monooxygenase SsuD/methylene tetrahydromethanopterin reductase-like flavin-dependent oxidoreductase (luciferase family)
LTDIRQNLGFYTLAGAPRSPRDLIEEMHDGERLGLGWAFISERLNIKEAATLCGAAAAVSSDINIATAASYNQNLWIDQLIGGAAYLPR